jgi:hypothetical protein
MYLYGTDFGEPFKPRKTEPAKPSPKAPQRPPPKEGKVIVPEGHWRFCGSPGDGSVTCDLNLRVRFRRSFAEFLRNVEAAYGRWMAAPTAKKLTQKLAKELKQWHEEILSARAFDNDPLTLVAGLFYKKSNGSWLVVDSSLRQWRRELDL